MAQVRTRKIDSIKNFDEPQLLRSIVFQLRETNDIERICFILDNITTKNLHLLDQLNHNLNLPKVFAGIVAKYCKGDLGIDQSEVTSYCLFHNRILRYVNRFICNESEKNVNIKANLLKTDMILSLGQILEEGTLNIMQNVVNIDDRETHEREYFLK